MKYLNKILYLVGVIIFVSAIFTIYFAIKSSNNTTWFIGVTFSLIGGAFIGAGFILDFKETMLTKETAGDQFSLMTKGRLIELLDKNNIPYEENKGREYYLYLVRENFEK